MRSCQHSESSSSRAQAYPMPREIAERKDANTRQRRRLRLAGFPSKPANSTPPSRNPAVVPEYTSCRYWYPAQNAPNSPAQISEIWSRAGRIPVIFQNMIPKRTHAVPTISPSIKVEEIRRASDAVCRGMSMPRRFSAAGCNAASIVIPPKAGGGGTTSGASSIRGRSITGSANSLSGATGGVHERGNSRILPVAGAGAAVRSLKSLCRSPAGISRDPSLVASRTSNGSHANAPLDMIAPPAIKFAGSSRTSPSTLWKEVSSNFNRSDGYRGGRGLRRAW